MLVLDVDLLDIGGGVFQERCRAVVFQIAVFVKSDRRLMYAVGIYVEGYLCGFMDLVVPCGGLIAQDDQQDDQGGDQHDRADDDKKSLAALFHRLFRGFLLLLIAAEKAL